MALAIALPGPAGASATGTATVNCTVNLPVWPTPNGPPVDCKGSSLVLVEGKTTTGSNYVLAGNGAFDGHADKYSETCVSNQALNGKANGTLITTNIHSVTPAGTAKSSIKFVWTRIGSSAIINLGAGVVNLPGGKTATGSKGTSVAVFVPTKPIPPGTCTAPKPLTAHIVGAAVLQS
jgi:hypothetical protein